MATREENLKKINEQLEKLDDEQLEQIAGGRIIEMHDFDTEKDLKPISDSIKSFKPV